MKNLTEERQIMTSHNTTTLQRTQRITHQNNSLERGKIFGLLIFIVTLWV